MDEKKPHPQVRALGPPQSVPVFNCHVYVSPRDASGSVSARCVNLPEVSASGATVREALAAIVAAFKKATAAYLGRGEAIPFVPPPPKVPGESERLLPVHL